MHNDDIDTVVLDLWGQRHGKLREEGLCRAVDRRKWAAHSSSRRTGKCDQAFGARVEHLIQKVVCDAQRACGIALIVGQVPFNGYVGKHARRDEPGIVEDQRDLDVVGALLYQFHVTI